MMCSVHVSAKGKGCGVMHKKALWNSLRRIGGFSVAVSCVAFFSNHLEERLLDQAQARTRTEPPLPPVGGRSHSIPKGMILDVLGAP